MRGEHFHKGHGIATTPHRSVSLGSRMPPLPRCLASFAALSQVPCRTAYLTTTQDTMGNSNEHVERSDSDPARTSSVPET